MPTKKKTPKKAAKRPTRNQPETFRARGIQASLTAKDLQRSVAWYRDAVGFVVEKEYKRDEKLMAVSLMAGSAKILISQDDGAKGLDRTKGEGISLMFTTAQDVDGLAKLIEERGGSLATQPADMPWGARVFRLRDPDGFNLVISSD